MKLNQSFLSAFALCLIMALAVSTNATAEVIKVMDMNNKEVDLLSGLGSTPTASPNAAITPEQLEELKKQVELLKESQKKSDEMLKELEKEQ